MANLNTKRSHKGLPLTRCMSAASNTTSLSFTLNEKEISHLIQRYKPQNKKLNRVCPMPIYHKIPNMRLETGAV